MGAGIKLGLYRQAKLLGLNVAGVSERALCEYVDRLENGSGQSGVLVGTNEMHRSDSATNDVVSDIDANDDAKLEYAEASVDEIHDDHRQFAKPVLDSSENTVDLYTRYIGPLLNHADKPTSRITQDNITAYLDSEGDVSNATRMNIIDALRVTFRDFLDRDTMDAFEMPGKSAKPTEVPSKDDLQTFYEALDNPKYKAAFLFAATSGLRSSELCQLTMDDINEDKRMLVPDKESSTKETWLTFYNEEAAEAFEHFREGREPGDERVFQTTKQPLNRKFQHVSDEVGVKVTI